MAYRDSDGKITIDEIAAERDIKQLNLSKESMETALKELNEIVAQSEEFSGNSAMRIREASMVMIKDIQKSIEQTDYAISNIQLAVKKNQQIDQDVKGLVNANGK